MTRVARRRALLLAVGVVVIATTLWVREASSQARNPIKVGILHSMTGPMAISEKSMADAELMAIAEINARGGLLGRPVEAVVADGRSDWPTYARQAERLITVDKVCTIFGCWTSASRKNVKPVVEKHDHLLFYPMAYEGLEISPCIIYTGAAPNQQIIPAVKWSYDNLGKRFFLVGSDYVWPHCVNAIARDELKALGSEPVGEDYIFFGSSDVSDVVEHIRRARPDVILSSVVGESNFAFYQALHKAGFRAETTPVVSVSIGEDELRKLIKTVDVKGNYAAWDYFQSIPRTENKQFVERFKARYGADRVTSDVIEAAYFSVLLWAQAVTDAGDDDVQSIRKNTLGQSLDAPEGIVSVDPETHHTWRSVFIGRFQADGQIDIVWSSQKPVRPVPYPLSRSRSEWNRFLEDMYVAWGHHWANPVPSRRAQSVP